MGSFIDYNNTDIRIYYIDMPCSVTSSVVSNDDGGYTIYINSRMSYEKQLEGYIHEMKHIYKNDLEFISDVQQLETDVRK